MTWQQQQEQHYLDRLRERWNEDGTRNIIFPIHRAGGKCLDGDTQVVLANGERKAIKSIRVNDEVVSYNPFLGVMEKDRVSKKWNSGQRETVTALTASHLAVTIR